MIAVTKGAKLDKQADDLARQAKAAEDACDPSHAATLYTAASKVYREAAVAHLDTGIFAIKVSIAAMLVSGVAVLVGHLA